MTAARYTSTALAALVFMLAAGGAFAAPEVSEPAYGEGAVDDDNPRVETRLLVDAQRLEPGESVRVGVLYTLDPEWHVYWRNPGDAGLTTDTDIEADGAQIGDLKWPAPTAFVDDAGEVYSFGYADEVLFFAEARVDEAASDHLQITAEVDYLACKIDCIPGQSTLEQSVPIADAGEKADDEVRRLFEQAEASVPRRPDQLDVEVEAVYSQEPIRPKDEFQAAIALDFCPGGDQACEPYEIAYDHRPVAFIPDDTFRADVEVIGLQDHPERDGARILQLAGRASAQEPDGDERLAGVIHLESPGGESTSLYVDQPFERADSDAEISAVESPLLAGIEAPAGSEDEANAPDEPATTEGTEVEAASRAGSPAEASDSEKIPLWKVILLAFLGGMILNLMPCVFPVLAIKVSSFTRLVHESKASTLSHGLAYTAGIVGSMMVLASVVLGLRATGTQVGWGFQFQEPLFIVALSAVLVVFALNLFGVFEISVGAGKLADKTEEASGLKRSFGEGVLAVVLATPCSAPFLGTAVGFALASSPAAIIGLFTMLGLGLAAPFVVLTLSPGWARLLPRPGSWMNVLKEVLGFALLGTVIWLAWILGQMTGSTGVVKLLIFLGVLALATWFVGKIQYRFDKGKKWSLVALAVALTAIAGAYTLQFERLEAAAPEARAGTDEIEWREWSEEAVQRELQAGHVVFVDFTADWCITCKTNERTIIDTEKVREAIDENEVITFKADWTNPDERIREKLAEHDKGGVPMYLVYHPDRPDEPELLPEVLTRTMLVEAFEQ